MQSRSIGLKNFQKEILFEASTAEEMFDKERELVEVGVHTYNLKEGGYGGWDHINDGSVEHIERCKRANSFKDSSYNFFKGKILGNNIRLLDVEHKNLMIEKSKSETAIKKRKETYLKIKHSQGSRNSQFGTMWITDGSSNRKIKRDDVIPEGWRKGRV